MLDRPISIRDIAEEAGVSIATVSRVINGKGRYSQETEVRIRKIIERHHYVPNVAAKSLKTNSYKLVGIVVPDITNEFFARIVQIIQYHLIGLGYAAFICNTNEDPYLEDVQIDMMRSQNIAGIIYISGHLPVDRKLRNLPTVFIDRKPINTETNAISVIESDNQLGAQLAVRELYARGRRRIGIINAVMSSSTHNQRYDGYREALRDLGLAFQADWHLQVQQVSYHEAFAVMSSFLEAGKAVDGLFCTTDWLAVGAIDAIRHHGLSVPKDIGVVGFDDISIALYRSRPLTTIHQDISQLGSDAVEILMKLIANPTMASVHKVIPVTLVKRATT